MQLVRAEQGLKHGSSDSLLPQCRASKVFFNLGEGTEDLLISFFRLDSGFRATITNLRTNTCLQKEKPPGAPNQQFLLHCQCEISTHQGGRVTWTYPTALPSKGLLPPPRGGSCLGWWQTLLLLLPHKCGCQTLERNLRVKA